MDEIKKEVEDYFAELTGDNLLKDIPDEPLLSYNSLIKFTTAFYFSRVKKQKKLSNG